jgi:hypothetical protein
MAEPEIFQYEGEPVFIQAPGPTNAIQVSGWKCGECDDIHINMVVKVEAPPNQEWAPNYIGFSISQEVARKLLHDIPDELEYPAPADEVNAATFWVVAF